MNQEEQRAVFVRVGDRQHTLPLSTHHPLVSTLFLRVKSHAVCWEKQRKLFFQLINFNGLCDESGIKHASGVKTSTLDAGAQPLPLKQGMLR